MPTIIPNLSELEHDLLTELFNIGIGGAANSLSQLVNQEIVLSIPSLQFKTNSQVIDQLGKNTKLFTIAQEMNGPFAMQSLLIFNPEDGFEVVKRMLGPHLSDETLAELQSEALTEIGNIVLNACIAVISEALGESFNIDLPIFRSTTPEDLLTESADGESDCLLAVEVELELKESAINGCLLFIFNTDSTENLQQTLASLLGNLQ
jgi:chemotaxis protein CheC